MANNPIRSSLPRIVHVTTAHPANDVRILERECRSLASSGRYSVFLAAPGTVPEGTGVRPIPLVAAPRARLGRFIEGPRKGHAISRLIQADLWHFHDPELLPIALHLSRTGHKVIWDSHEDYVAQLATADSKAWVPKPFRSVVKAGMATLLGAVDGRVSAVVAATPTIAEGYSNPRTVIVGNEARLDDFLGCKPNFAARRVLFTGTTNPGHLFREIVGAIEGLPGVTLAVAGRDPDPIVWGAAKSTLGSRISYLGWLDRPGLRQAINDSTLGLATYVNSATYAVASPTKTFEFCAAGLPVVTTPNPCNVQTFESGAGGFLTKGFTTEDIRAGIRNALSDEEAWISASENGRLWASREGSWANSEKRLLDVYQEILGR